MLILLLLVELAICMAILHKEIVQLRFRNLASSVFFLVYAIVYIIEPLILHLFYGGATSIVPRAQTHFTDPHVYYLFHGYGIALLVTYLLLGQSRASEVEPPAAPVEPANYGSATALLIIAGFAIFVYSTGMSFVELFAASRFAWFREISFSIFWLTVSSYFLALSALFAYYARISRKGNAWLLLLGLAAIVMHGLITKDRKWVIFLVSGWLAGHYQASGRKLAIKPRGALILGALFLLMVISQFVRDVLFRYVLGEQVSLLDQLAQWWSSHAGEGSRGGANDLAPLADFGAGSNLHRQNWCIIRINPVRHVQPLPSASCALR